MTQIETKPGTAAVHESETRLEDVMQGATRREIKIHEHGFIALIDVMPRLVPEGQTADAAIVQSARVSYGHGTKKVHEDRGLIRYLLRHRHTTPFEMVEFKFHISMPIFIARQWIRHRTANVNEYSGRYSIMPDHFYQPSLNAVRKQSSTNRQGGSETFDTREANAPGRKEEAADVAASGERQTAQDFLNLLARAEALYPDYETLVESGVSREMARIALPLSTYTQWYWKCDLHNILHFLKLRMDEHAQEEIRVYAMAMHDLIQPIVPVTMEAFRDYHLQSMNLTRLEVAALRDLMQGGTGDLDTTNSREQREWAAKIDAFGKP